MIAPPVMSRAVTEAVIADGNPLARPGTLDQLAVVRIGGNICANHEQSEWNLMTFGYVDDDRGCGVGAVVGGHEHGLVRVGLVGSCVEFHPQIGGRDGRRAENPSPCTIVRDPEPLKPSSSGHCSTHYEMSTAG